jgi:prepilin-type N-terminal cleavage/methylation domain-containing protein/prepilin-type processing-associated H-X9-DG protein
MKNKFCELFHFGISCFTNFRRRSNRISRGRGFTLIELVVVVSILSVLLSLLLPALAQARAQARGAVCASNIRQLFLANSGYALENDGYYAVAARDIWGANLQRWHGVRANVNEPFDPGKGPLAGYLEDGEVRRCPGFQRNNYHEEAGQQSGNFEAGCGGYGYNDEYVGGRSDEYGMREGARYSARDFKIENPARTVMFTDTAFRQRLAGGVDTYIEYSFAHPPFWHWYIQMLKFMPGLSGVGVTGRPAPTIHFRHSGFTNVSWCDGHISKETMDWSAPYVTHAIMNKDQTAEMALGWFGPDDNSLFDLK